MKYFMELLTTFIQMTVAIVLAGACIGLFLGTAWKFFCWAV